MVPCHFFCCCFLETKSDGRFRRLHRQTPATTTKRGILGIARDVRDSRDSRNLDEWFIDWDGRASCRLERVEGRGTGPSPIDRATQKTFTGFSYRVFFFFFFKFGQCLRRPVASRRRRNRSDAMKRRSESSIIWLVPLIEINGTAAAQKRPIGAVSIEMKKQIESPIKWAAYFYAIIDNEPDLRPFLVTLWCTRAVIAVIWNTRANLERKKKQKNEANKRRRLVPTVAAQGEASKCDASATCETR